MIVDRYDPINLFEMVPKLRLEMEPQLAELDRLLDDEALFETVKADLSPRRPNSERGSDDTPRRLR
jgi:transposase, IS5 family